jgi:hypothetical protein
LQHTFEGTGLTVQEVFLIAEGGYAFVWKVRSESGESYALKKVRCIDAGGLKMA